MAPFFSKGARPASSPLTGRSYWQRHGGAPAASADASTAGSTPPAKVDYCVIGGGFAGLATALSLRDAEPDAQIAILEAKFLGFGASGRNAGLLSPLPAPLWLASAAGHPEHLWGLGHLNRRVHEIARWLSAEAPEARVEPRPLRIEAQGHLTATGLARVARLLGKGGLEHREVGGSAGRYSVELDTHTLDPYRTVAALGDLARRHGIAICERAPVSAIEEADGGAVVRLADGRTLAAKCAVACTNAYSGTLTMPGSIPAKVVYNFMVATDRLPERTSARTRAAPPFVVELNTSYVYYRAHDGHIVYGGIERFKPYGASDFDVPPDVLASIERLLLRSFPGADLIPVEAWGGVYHQTSTDLPVIETRGARGAIVINAGYGGTGVAMTLICGRIAAALARGGRFSDPDDERLLMAMRGTRVPIGSLARFVASVAGDVLMLRRPRVRD